MEDATVRTKLSGIIPVIPTPLNDDETVDVPALKQVLNYAIDGGVHGV